jgi:hypothetical protein
VPLHHFVLVGGQPGLLQQHRVGDPDLADVVKVPAAAQGIDIARGESQFGAERRGVPRQTLGVAFGVGVSRFYRESQAGDDRLGQSSSSV